MPTERIVAYVVRHGETQLNAEGRFRGPTDAPLSDKGHEDAENLRKLFSKVSLGAAYTSSKTRAMQTAEHVLDPKGISASPTDSLHAWNVGYLAGEVKKDHKSDIDYFQRNENEQIPAGESLNEFRARVRPALLQAIHKGVTDGDPSVVFAHSSVIHELGNIVHHDHTASLVKPGGVAVVKFDGSHFTAEAFYKALDDAEGKYAG
jgi:broad specificity phosphatase PhoE